MGVDLRTGSGSRGGICVMDHILYFYNYVHIFIVHRDFDNSDCLTLPRVVLIMYCCTPSDMLGHVTSSAYGQLYTIKTNKDFLMRLLKRGSP